MHIHRNISQKTYSLGKNVVESVNTKESCAYYKGIDNKQTITNK